MYLIKNTKAFSFLEVIIASGIILVIALGSLSLVSDRMKTQRGLQAKDTMRDFTTEIRSTLSNSKACINTFTGQNLSLGSTVVTTIKDENNLNKFVAGKLYMGDMLNFNKIIMQDFVADSSNPNTGYAKLYIYAIPTGQTIGFTTIHHILSAKVEIDQSTKNILNCLTVGGLSDSLWQVSPTTPTNIYYQGGRVAIGKQDATAMLEVQSDGATLPLTPGFKSSHFGTGGEANGIAAVTARGTAQSPTAIQNGDRFLSIIGTPYNGTFYHNSAGIQFYATENHSPAGQGAAITFETIANGTPVTAGVTSRVERMRVDHTGNVGINTTTPQTKLDVNGPIRPGNATLGSSCSSEGAFAYDKSAHIPIFCDGSNWKATGNSTNSISTTIVSANACGNNTINANCIPPYVVTGCGYQLTYWDSTNPNNSPDEVYPVSNGCQMHAGGGGSCYNLYTICSKIN